MRRVRQACNARTTAAGFLFLLLLLTSSIAALSNSDNQRNLNGNMPTASSSLRQFLLNGGKSYGPLLMSDSPIVAEIIAMAGYGHVVIDHEHCPTNVHSFNGQTILQSIDAAAATISRFNNNQYHHHHHSSEINNQQLTMRRITEPIIRIPGPNDPIYIKKVLDTMKLPGGILIPMVEDAPTALSMVRAIRYPQQHNNKDSNEKSSNDGIRGCAIPFIRATSYGMIDQETYLHQCYNDLLVMVQVESPQAIAAISDIASIDGIDAIFLGPLDLSATIGKMGLFNDPEFQNLIATAEHNILQSNKCLLAGFKPPNQTIQAMFDKGYSLLCGSVDLGLIRDAARIDAKKGYDAIQKVKKSE